MSLLTVNLDGGMTDAGLSLAPIGALFTQSGILKPASFTVSALGSPGMFVQVSGSDDDDIAIIKTADGSTYYIKNTELLPVQITANSSGVTKTDAIVLFVDVTGGDDENAGSPGAAQVIAVRRDGVSTGAPTSGEIDAATGNNPWLKLREVTVEHNTGEIEGPDLGYSAARTNLAADIISELTSGNGVIIDGLNIKDGKLNTNNSVVENNITDSAVTATKIAPNSLMLAAVPKTTNFSTSSTTAVQVTGLTATVTIPAGGRSVKITAFAKTIYNSGANFWEMTIWDGAVGSGTQIATCAANPGANVEVNAMCVAIQTPSAGSKTYNVGLRGTGGTTTLTTASTGPALLLVELI